MIHLLLTKTLVVRAPVQGVDDLAEFNLQASRPAKRDFDDART
jgi:hypothetical protein